MTRFHATTEARQRAVDCFGHFVIQVRGPWGVRLAEMDGEPFEYFRFSDAQAQADAWNLTARGERFIVAPVENSTGETCDE